MTVAERRRREKHAGRHYTPPELAAYFARLALEHLEARRLAVFDPACGDGALLLAVLDELERTGRKAPHLAGMELEPRAREIAASRLEGRTVASLQLRQGDFLEHRPPDLFGGDGKAALPVLTERGFDLVIANPPYVRTQVLGARRAQELASSLGLSGRVDLYQAFVRAMTPLLAQGAVLALLCPNRFMTTRSGAAMRDLLAREFQILQLVDLGDTGLFRAAVLPAILIARRASGGRRSATPFVRVYRAEAAQSRPGPRTAPAPAGLLDALAGRGKGRLQIEGRGYRIDRGAVELPGDGRSTWNLLSPAERDWSARIGRRRHACFEDLARIRVGVKTTADAVFIRDDWDRLPAGERPEPELLRPLLTHRDAAPYLARGRPSMTILYPHTIEDERRRPVDLNRHPRARSYLERHRPRLASRRYLIEARREWYELWVPHDPRQWSRPKIVAPDISKSPRFHLDRTGAVVNGDCYWITLRPDRDPRLLLLILAVANSSLATRYYDNLCSNRLYSGRRRYITQYLNSFPVPNPDADPAARIIRLVERRLEAPPGGPHPAELEAAIDRLVSRAFEMPEEPAGRLEGQKRASTPDHISLP